MADYRGKYEEHKARNKRQKWTYKILALKHYGGGPPKCACCGEVEIGFLSLDHMNNDGFKHRKTQSSGHEFYRWLVQKKFPKNLGLAVMCYNCNFGRSRNNGICPHIQPQTRLTCLLQKPIDYVDEPTPYQELF